MKSVVEYEGTYMLRAIYKKYYERETIHVENNHLHAAEGWMGTDPVTPGNRVQIRGWWAFQWSLSCFF